MRAILGPEDLHVNMWVAVTQYQTECATSFFGTPMDVERPCDGKPWQIKAVSLPFICVSDGHTRRSLDVRTVRLTRLHKRYVRMLREQAAQQTLAQRHGQYVHQVDDVEECEDEEPDLGCCPVCGETLVERLDNRTRKWFLACKECGFQGTIPEDGAEE